MKRSIVLTGCLLRFTLLADAAQNQPANASPKPVPTMQAIPLPDHQISFQRDGVELGRYHFDPSARRPFVFPVNGPSGRSLTRMGHPRDPESHSHHNSVWISHNDVNGVSFWDDRGKGRIIHQRIERFDDSDTAASVLTVNAWIDETGKVLLTERRQTQVQKLPENEWLLIIDLQLEPKGEPVTLGKTPFGLIGVRMAKTIGVNDGGGTIRNSEGGVNEAGVFWKPARWVDYSGPIKASATEGITLMDHPSNPNHPSIFHVRNDGWMGASLTHQTSRTIEPGQPLKLRYGLYVHSGMPEMRLLEKRWKDFAR
jgi:methane monooxygenase PmoA-like